MQKRKKVKSIVISVTAMSRLFFPKKSVCHPSRRCGSWPGPVEIFPEKQRNPGEGLRLL